MSTMTKVAATGYYLENKLGTHNKFYTILILDDGTVLTNWGKIGTAGQVKVDKLPSLGKADDLGKRQLYSKKSRGYNAVAEDVKFEVTNKAVNDAHAGAPRGLVNAFGEARLQPMFDGDSNVAMRHFDDFSDKAQALLTTASDMPFDELFNRFEELSKAWAALDEKHAEVAVIVDLTQQTLRSRLASGNL